MKNLKELQLSMDTMIAPELREAYLSTGVDYDKKVLIYSLDLREFYHLNGDFKSEGHGTDSVIGISNLSNTEGLSTRELKAKVEENYKFNSLGEIEWVKVLFESEVNENGRGLDFFLGTEFLNLVGHRVHDGQLILLAKIPEGTGTKYQINRYLDNIEEVATVYSRHVGYEISLLYAYQLWSLASYNMSAAWLTIPNSSEGIIGRIENGLNMHQ